MVRKAGAGLDGRRAPAARRNKICIISSPGGHLTEALALKPCYEKYDHFYVLNDHALLAADMEGRTYFIRHSERDLLFFMNLLEAWRILRRERPALILSTGAGAVVPFTLVGKLLGVRSLFVETFTRVTKPSLTGRIMYRLADRFFYQCDGVRRYFPKAVCGGPLV
jgi:UDP-N-acetylglucosamine:LPS N-acetylglucosamine transferase